MPISNINETIDGLIKNSENPQVAFSYVNADILNVRNAPIDGEIVSQLIRGESVQIYQKSNSGAWSNLSSDNDNPMWVANKYLCSGENCYQKLGVFTDISDSKNKSAKYSNNSSITAEQKTTNNKTSTAKKSTATFYSGSCPCSGNYSCTGPRGGKYCYTNSGNKRYR